MLPRPSMRSIKWTLDAMHKTLGFEYATFMAIEKNNLVIRMPPRAHKTCASESAN